MWFTGFFLIYLLIPFIFLRLFFAFIIHVLFVFYNKLQNACSEVILVGFLLTFTTHPLTMLSYSLEVQTFSSGIQIGKSCKNLWIKSVCVNTNNCNQALIYSSHFLFEIWCEPEIIKRYIQKLASILSVQVNSNVFINPNIY